MEVSNILVKGFWFLSLSAFLISAMLGVGMRRYICSVSTNYYLRDMHSIIKQALSQLLLGCAATINFCDAAHLRNAAKETTTQAVVMTTGAWDTGTYKYTHTYINSHSYPIYIVDYRRRSQQRRRNHDRATLPSPLGHGHGNAANDRAPVAYGLVIFSGMGI